MERLTTDQPLGIMQACLNLFYARDGEAWARDEGPGPLHKDVRLFDFIREAIRATVDEERDCVADFSDEELGEVMLDWLADGNTSVEGLIGTLYTAAWAFAEIRARLKAYEDTGLEPEEIEKAMSGCAELVACNQLDCNLQLTCNQVAIKDINDLGGVDHIRELAQAEKAGRLVVLPCKIGDTVYLSDHDRVIEAEVTCIRPFVFQDRIEFRGNAAWRFEDPFHHDGRILEQDVFIVFGKDAYLTREEAEAHVLETDS